MEEWLHFMARLARAQHVVAMAMGPFPELGQVAVEQAVRARMPPLSADGHRRDAAWRDALAMLLDSFDDRDIPAPARSVMASLSEREAKWG
jgi:FdhE protein